MISFCVRFLYRVCRRLLRSSTRKSLYEFLRRLDNRICNSDYKYISNFWRSLDIGIYSPAALTERSKFDHNALWSAPASGNHWVRFIVEYLTTYPTQGHSINAEDKPIFMNKFPGLHHPLADVKRNRHYILYKSHDTYPLTEKSTLLLLVRDFYEYLGHGGEYVDSKMLVRDFYGYLGHGGEYVDSKMTRRFLLYIELLVAYDSFSGTKMLIYYEDLVSEPEREICRIKDFFNVPEVRCRTFMNRYDYYSELSRQGENRIWSGSNSGIDTKFYRKNESEKVVAERVELFYKMLAQPEYQRVKPYIARYMH